MRLLRSFQAGSRRAFPDYGSATTSFEVEDFLCRLPKVAQEQQPWALIQNLFEVFRVRAMRVLSGEERFKVQGHSNAECKTPRDRESGAGARALQKLAHCWLGLLQSAVVP